MFNFAAELTIHFTPTEIFTIGGFSITNSMFYGLITSFFTASLLIYIARNLTLHPKRGFTQYIEIGTDFIFDLLESALGSRAKAAKYSPYFVTLFFFLLFSNWLGLMPGVGEAFQSGGQPLFRPFTADLNGTLAAALLTWLMVQFFAIKENGPLKHLRHYFNGSLKNPLTIFLGIFEIFSDFTRIGSLALRLFLNVAVGEIIIAVFSSLGGVFGWLTALPFTVLELFVGALQAYIFVMLAVMYLAVATSHSDHEEHEEGLTIDEVVAMEVGKASN
jgi:F-type H+-transporting ATPase subunit a